MNRRAFVAASIGAIPAGFVAEACVEPLFLKTRWLRLSRGEPNHRIVHFTDVHYRGGRRGFERVVSRINALKPDLICFTGDLVEERRCVEESLDILAGIKAPVFGIPGNHGYWADIPFDKVAACLASTGGRWLLDQQVSFGDGSLVVTGAAGRRLNRRLPPPVEGRKNLLLIHYPAWIRKVEDRFDLALAGHSHGGQVRLPFYGPLIVPFSVEGLDVGLFQTPAGPLYVNPGVGWFAVPFRLNCRPEITVITL